MYYTTQGTQPIFCINCKWKVTSKNFIKIFKKFFKKRAYLGEKKLSRFEGGEPSELLIEWYA